MSIPLQVLVSSGALLPAVEEICGRAGTVHEAQAVWVAPAIDDPDWAARATAQVAQMLGSRAHEGGFAQVLFADGAEGLRRLAGLARATAWARPPWAQIGVVIAEEAEAARLDGLGLTAVHAVPRTLAHRVLDPAERERAAVNLVGLVLDILRLPVAREPLQTWCSIYGGARVTIAQAARFQAPVVQKMLARRLAAKVADRMVQTIAEGRNPSTAPKIGPPPEPPRHDIEAELRERATDIGEWIAARIVGDGELPDEDEVARRADLATADLPARLEDVLQQHGDDLRGQALAWQGELRRWSDHNLERAGFAALPILVESLGRWRETSGAAPAAAGDHGPAQAMAIDPPDDGEVRAAAQAHARARAAHDDSGVLFGGWTLAIAAVTGLAAWAGLAKAADLRALAAGGVGIAVALAGWAIAALRAAHVRRVLARLAAAEQSARLAYRAAWSRLIVRQIAAIGQHLRDRMLRFADEVAATEVDALRAVQDTLRDLQQVHHKQDRMRAVGDGRFESDIRLSESFYAKAESRADPTEIFDTYDDQLRAVEWRRKLEFMNHAALHGRCMRRFAEFAEHIPFDKRQELREVAIGPAEEAIRSMTDHLIELLPIELGADRMVVAPTELAGAVPQDGVGHQRLHAGLADIYVAATRPAIDADRA